MIDKDTNTDPLIILTPDEVIKFRDGLTIASFDKCLKIFVDTVGSDNVFCNPSLERATPTTQIGLLNSLPGYSKSSQTKGLVPQ